MEMFKWEDYNNDIHMSGGAKSFILTDYKRAENKKRYKQARMKDKLSKIQDNEYGTEANSTASTGAGV